MGAENLYNLLVSLKRIDTVFPCIFQRGNANTTRIPWRCFQSLLQWCWAPWKRLVSILPSKQEICEEALQCLARNETHIQKEPNEKTANRLTRPRVSGWGITLRSSKQEFCSLFGCPHENNLLTQISKTWACVLGVCWGVWAGPYVLK